MKREAVIPPNLRALGHLLAPLVLTLIQDRDRPFVPSGVTLSDLRDGPRIKDYLDQLRAAYGLGSRWPQNDDLLHEALAQLCDTGQIFLAKDRWRSVSRRSPPSVRDLVLALCAVIDLDSTVVEGTPLDGGECMDHLIEAGKIARTALGLAIDGSEDVDDNGEGPPPAMRALLKEVSR